jgi:hypothetical protein
VLLLPKIKLADFPHGEIDSNAQFGMGKLDVSKRHNLEIRGFRLGFNARGGGGSWLAILRISFSQIDPREPNAKGSHVTPNPDHSRRFA